MYAFLPEICLVLSVLFILLAGAFKFDSKISKLALTICGVSLALIASLILIFIPSDELSGEIAVKDQFAMGASVLILVIVLLLLAFMKYSDEENQNNLNSGELFIFILTITLGCLLSVSSVNLIMLFASFGLIDMGCNFLSFSGSNTESGKARTKLTTFRIVISGLMLFGISLVYGITGSFSYAVISAYLGSNAINPSVFTYAILLLLPAFCFKNMLYPFNLIQLKASNEISLTSTSFVIIPVAAAGFLTTARFYSLVLHDNSDSSLIFNISHLPVSFAAWFLIIISVVTITHAIFLMILEQDLMKIVVFSVFVQLSAVILIFAGTNFNGTKTALTLLIVVTLVSCCTFFNLILIKNKFGSLQIEKLRGRYRSAPLLFICLFINLASFSCIPFTSGFTTKLFAFSALLGGTNVWIGFLILISSLISAFVYFRFFREIFLFRIQGRLKQYPLTNGEKIMLLITLAPAILPGIYLTPVIQAAEYLLNYAGMK